MYENYWKLREKPFSNTPDPRFFFLSRQHEEALTRMLYAITENQGAMLLTGECGCGKTLLSRVLVDQLDPARFDVALLSHPSLDDRELLQEILRQFGWETESGNKASLLRALGSILANNQDEGRHTVVLVDEAQLVKDPATLEEFRLLLNSQRNRRFLLTLLLVGQPELRERASAMPQLLQRLSVRYHLERFTAEESHEYLSHRLRAAGCQHDLFTSKAEDALVAASEGIPRRLNNLADMALLVGFGVKAPIIEEDVVHQVAADLALV